MASSSDGRAPDAAALSAGAIDQKPVDRFASLEEVRISEIVLAAAALEVPEREEYLRQVTVTEPGLLKEARRRLEQAAELPATFLAVPAAELLEAVEQAARPAAPSMPQFAASERYELGECLGRGGMARVFKAFDRQLHRPVALKLLEQFDPKTSRRFLREAQAQARVRHEYVLEVYETGELGGQPYIAMYYVDGPTLMEIRDETTLEQKVRLMAQVAEGLHAAHREGLIHRDVKPSNVLVEVTPDGKLKPWVADFGIATGLGKGSSMLTAMLAGTPCYIAPERLRDDQPVDRRSDVYSLGVTFYQLLAGELPFHDSSIAEVLRQVEQDQPLPLSAHVPVPAEVEAIVSKCMAKDPDRRYPSARAVAEDLWRYLDGEKVEAHTGTLTYRLSRPAARKKTLFWVMLTAALVLALVLGAFVAATTDRARRAADEAIAALDSLAGLHYEQGRYTEAVEVYRRTLAIREERLGLDHPSVAEVLVDLAAVETELGEYAAAERDVRRALAILSQALPAGDPSRARAESVLAAAHAGQGRSAVLP